MKLELKIICLFIFIAREADGIWNDQCELNFCYIQKKLNEKILLE